MFNCSQGIISPSSYPCNNIRNSVLTKAALSSELRLQGVQSCSGHCVVTDPLASRPWPTPTAITKLAFSPHPPRHWGWVTVLASCRSLFKSNRCLINRERTWEQARIRHRTWGVAQWRAYPALGSFLSHCVQSGQWVTQAMVGDGRGKHTAAQDPSKPTLFLRHHLPGHVSTLVYVGPPVWSN